MSLACAAKPCPERLPWAPLSSSLPPVWHSARRSRPRRVPPQPPTRRPEAGQDRIPRQRRRRRHRRRQHRPQLQLPPPRRPRHRRARPAPAPRPRRRGQRRLRLRPPLSHPPVRSRLHRCRAASRLRAAADRSEPSVQRRVNGALVPRGSAARSPSCIADNVKRLPRRRHSTHPRSGSWSAQARRRMVGPRTSRSLPSDCCSSASQVQHSSGSF